MLSVLKLGVVMLKVRAQEEALKARFFEIFRLNFKNFFRPFFEKINFVMFTKLLNVTKL
jgi:hypothetical protein